MTARIVSGWYVVMAVEKLFLAQINGNLEFLDANDERAVKDAMHRFVKPWLARVSADRQSAFQISLAYFLKLRDFPDLVAPVQDLEMSEPHDNRAFFMWMWEVLYPESSPNDIDTTNVVESGDSMAMNAFAGPGPLDHLLLSDKQQFARASRRLDHAQEHDTGTISKGGDRASGERVSLTENEIRMISEWQPIRDGYGRGADQTAIRIAGIAHRIASSGDIGCEFVADDGLSNYFVLFAYPVADVPSNPISRKVEGRLIYLSACGPVGVIGCSRKFVVPPPPSSHEPLHIDLLLAPDLVHSRMDTVVIEAIRFAGYELLRPDEVSQPLPEGVVPYEYCHCAQPWDRVFHALFANTD